MSESYKNPLVIRTTLDFRKEPVMVELLPADGPYLEVGFNLNLYDVEVIFTEKFRPGYYLYTAGDTDQLPLHERRLNHYHEVPWEHPRNRQLANNPDDWTRVEVSW